MAHSGGMTKSIIGKGTETRSEVWQARITEQQHSGLSVERFCREQGLSEPSFYAWRKRLRQSETVRFALVEPGAAPSSCQPALELLLSGGDRLRISGPVDAAVLRTVLEVLRR